MPTDEKLLEFAVKYATSPEYRKGVKHFRWVAVRDTFGVGSTSAHNLCVRFGLNPDEYVRR